MHPRRALASALIGALAAGALAAAPRPASAVVGGSTADATTVPWVVALLHHAQSDPLYAQFCGGTLIAPSWVLTAAHCVQGVAPSSVDAVLGVTFLSNIQPTDRRAIDSIVIEPRYDSYRDLYDIALLHLAAPAAGVTPMTLNADAAAPATNTSLRTYGWGNTSIDTDAYANDLQSVGVTDLAGPAGACGSYSATAYVSEHMLCAGAIGGGQDACQGDTGGPLVTTGPNPVLVGVTSVRLSCGQAGYPGIWVRVSSHAPWINSVMTPSAPTLGIGAVLVPEGDRGVHAVYFRVTLSKPSASTVSVHYATVNGTAVAPSDYTAASGVLVIPAGQSGGWIGVNVNGDTVIEPTETFTVRLSAAAGGAVITRADGVGRIWNDEVHTQPIVQIADAGVVEGNDGQQYVRVPIVLSRPVASPVIMYYGTADGTAHAGFDYTAASGTITIPAGTVAANVTIWVQPEWLHESGGNETFNIRLSNLLGPAVLVRGLATVTIVGDD